MERGQFLRAVQALNKAAYDIRNLWDEMKTEDVEADILDQDLSYPFHKDFAEIQYDINLWAMRFEEEYNRRPLSVRYGMCIIATDETSPYGLEKDCFYKVSYYNDRIEILDELGRCGPETVDNRLAMERMIANDLYFIPKPLYNLFISMSEGAAGVSNIIETVNELVKGGIDNK
jgi:hypothetical protein